MHPSPTCIYFLAHHSFIRNYNASHLFNVQKWIDTNVFIWYCVGIINDKRYVHCIRFIKKSPKPGITSYFIEWFNTAPFSQLEQNEIPSHFDSVHFWVHSGVALRKNFFLFQDRMSLIRSTFYFDDETKLFYRMSILLPYLNISEEMPKQVQIFTTSARYYCFQKRNKKRKFDETLKKRTDFVKCFKKFIESHNHRHFIQINYPKLFEESQSIFLGNGNSP
jgi:hypothetical protein